jgi:maltooligosyltrehalose trehalohydrolase
MNAPQHVTCIQNHDQVGNRAKGERLTELVPRGARIVAAALLLLAPETPLLFMGQEYDEPAPFQFFTSYSDPALKKAVSEGRRREFKEFDWRDVPDPEDPATFKRSKLNWDLALRGKNHILQWYTDLIALRKRLITAGPRTCKAEWHREGVLTMQVPADEPKVSVIALLTPNKNRDRRRELLRAHAPSRGWREALCCEEDGYEVRVYERTA